MLETQRAIALKSSKTPVSDFPY